MQQLDAGPVTQPRSGLPLPRGELVGFLLAVAVVALIALISYRALQTRSHTAANVTHTLDVLQQLQNVLATLRDAETGQRGFLLTGEAPYLEPYTLAKAALPEQFGLLRSLTSGDVEQQLRLGSIERIASEKIEELQQTITLRSAGDFAGAVAIVRTDRGKLAMDRLRFELSTMERVEREQLAKRQEQWRDAATYSSFVTWGGSGSLLILILVAAVLASRDYRYRQAQAWLQAGQMGFSLRMQGEQRLERLGERAMEFLANYLHAQVGAIYIGDDSGGFQRVAGYAIPAGTDRGALRPGDGLLGQAAKENRVIHLREVPQDYLSIGSALGSGKAEELLIAPASVNGVVYAVMELGFFRSLHPEEAELLARISESFGVAVRASKDRTRLEMLLEETQRQGEELQTQQEELRVSNEELAEQGHALKDSQARLEAQHAELEQTNSQLEEQAEALERQKDELSRAQAILIDKATELERANQYKSEFLANMSHELRTPLNSSLILSKLLADNKDGNLNEQQVKFAQTILSAGNDLLTLINDVLDLSKIEAGQVEVIAEPVALGRIVDSLVKTFEPVARQKNLPLKTIFDNTAPVSIETDAQRLGQILKNLIANALKFTERGEVSLRVFSDAAETVSFAVRDTGIGIPAQQQEIVFEAFRQADGSTHRKYGGTGLGLSISRDLARLLGGELSVHSVPGEGSVFTLTLPIAYTAAEEKGKRGGMVEQFAGRVDPAPAPTMPPAPPVQTRTGTTEDDRERLLPDSRTVLIVEDDTRFACILRDLARELGFQCVVTHTASEGLAAAGACRPSAILLDMNLPDHSGLGVLDQLKRNPLTRHIPVHVISVADYSREALELGAIGYALKPVKRDQLVDAFKRLETKFSQSLRRVLVVEDDERQRESIRQLLGNSEVEITTVETAGAALEHLRATNFDCVVMDLNLPDLSGYELLEKMAMEEGVPFPPVIVYTGRSLTLKEEQKLNRYSRSIIIKDARSPERLLDEVMLFIHQVEAKLPMESQRMLKAVRDRETILEGRRILIVEDDVRNIFALSSVLEPKGARVEIARNGREALEMLSRNPPKSANAIDLVLMDIMMPEMDGLTAMREIRKQPEWQKLPIIALTAKAMKDDHDKCLAAGANDYLSKPLDVEKLLSLVRVWMPK